MAKKAAEVPAAAEKISKADAVRRSLAEGIEKPQEAVDYIKKQFGIEMSTGMFSSYKSQHKAAADGGGATTGRGRGRPAVSGQPTLADLIRAKKLVDEFGDAAKLRALVEKLAEFGDLNNLEKCLAGLSELNG